MKQQWDIGELVEHFTLLPSEAGLLGGDEAHNQLGKAVTLKFFQYEGRSPESKKEVPPAIVAFVAQQLGIQSEIWTKYKWKKGRAREHRREIRELLGFRKATVADQETLRDWLEEEVLPHEHRPLHLEQIVRKQLRRQHLEPPTTGRVRRLVASAIHRYEQAFFARTSERLSEQVQANLKRLVTRQDPLLPELDLTEEDQAEVDEDEPGRYPMNALRSGAGPAKVASVKEAAARLRLLQEVGLPEDLFAGIPVRFLRVYSQRAAVEAVDRLRTEETPLYITLLAAFCWVRQRVITDYLVDLFLRILNDIRIRAEHRVERAIVAEFKRVGGKQRILYRLADAMIANPKGIIEEVLYPLVGLDRLKHLVKEYKSKGTYRQSVQTRIHGSYSHHYRQMLPPFLDVLEFRSNNEQHKPLIKALEIVATYLNVDDAFYPKELNVPLDDVVGKAWHAWVYLQDRYGRTRVRRVRYELCVLQSLRDKLRCKEIWVAGADRYRNPDEDVPADFSDKREEYYDSLTLPLEAETFVADIKSRLKESLQALNDTMPDNAFVEILPVKRGHIRVAKLKAQRKPTNLGYLKNDIRRRWWMTSLLDILKEAELRIGFTDSFKSLTGQERLPRAELRKRLLLCLFGLGTNTGLTSVSMGDHGASYAQLNYVSRRFIAKDALRQAIRQVVDATLAARQPHIWGEVTSWCASDAKQFAAWSQNLLSQWHRRYRKTGVSVYWHVAKGSLCIYSQLKAPSSSEVAAMIEGVLRHCTALKVDRNYVDTLGQSEVAFAFCELLGFQLMPRFRHIHDQKLHLADKEDVDAYPHLQPILRRDINWGLIARQYNEMVKYATALRLGTADAEAILKRFTRHNNQHPTYKALVELGKALKSIFICRYLMHEEVRREIQGGLNVVENWNSAISFVFYGNQGEIGSNDLDMQEIAILAMHLLQACLAYVNTLMLQEVLAEPDWFKRMTEADWRGLTPLFYRHVNPYGVFQLDMERRIPLAA